MKRDNWNAVFVFIVFIWVLMWASCSPTIRNDVPGLMDVERIEAQRDSVRKMERLRTQIPGESARRKLKAKK